MNKDKFIETMAQQTGLTKISAAAILEASLDIISSALIAGESVQFLGFGTFEVRNRAPRVGRNPQANVPVNIPARKVPYFNPSKGFRDAVNKGGK